MSTMTLLNADVTEAVRELEEVYGDVMLEPDESGGTYVTILSIELGPSWSRRAAPLTFHLPFNYPSASPYPYYLPGDLELGGPWPDALQRIRWRDQDVIQVSLRHNHWDPQNDRVLGCVLQVRDWLQR